MRASITTSACEWKPLAASEDLPNTSGSQSSVHPRVRATDSVLGESRKLWRDHPGASDPCHEAIDVLKRASSPE